MKILKGIPASIGLARGPAFLYREMEPEVVTTQIADPAVELAMLDRALAEAKAQIEAIRLKAEQEAGAEQAAIFEAHALFLSDPTLSKAVRSAVEKRRINATAAWRDAVEGYALQMESLGDETFRARAADIRDVGRRVLRLLLGESEADLTSLVVPSVIVAQDLTPSDTVRFDKSCVLGFCTAHGGPTSHAAILAKALGLPAVVGIREGLDEVEPGTTLLVDGEQGEVVVEPDADARRSFEARWVASQARDNVEWNAAQAPAMTRDGKRVEVVANVGSIGEASAALEAGAEGIGLVRTEFLYLQRKTPPGEEEQSVAYRAIMEIMAGRPVVVRTLDVGGDKELPYLDLGREPNPFLGYRAIRICLEHPEIFGVQLRALLRSGAGHDLRIMFPMIATLDELRRAKACLAQAQEEVLDAGGALAGKLQVGIMVEVPSVVVMADKFARQVDFFGIGTNDLTQYTMAAERTNERVAGLSDACHPAVLRQIQRVVDAGHEAGIWVGVCGELAGEPDAIPILLGMGLDEFSLVPGSIPRAKAILRQWLCENVVAWQSSL